MPAFAQRCAPLIKLLGAILAGGASRRFGSDKAAALLDGLPLIEHVRAALVPQVDALILCGRDWPGMMPVADLPERDLGPLGGLCAALAYARDNGFAEVLTVGCDVLPVPADLAERLRPAPAVADGQPLFGRWPAALADRLLQHLLRDHSRSVRAWVEAAGARRVPLDVMLHNFNRAEDLATYAEARKVTKVPVKRGTTRDLR